MCIRDRHRSVHRQNTRRSAVNRQRRVFMHDTKNSFEGEFDGNNGWHTKKNSARVGCARERGAVFDWRQLYRVYGIFFTSDGLERISRQRCGVAVSYTHLSSLSFFIWFILSDVQSLGCIFFNILSFVKQNKEKTQAKACAIKRK